MAVSISSSSEGNSIILFAWAGRTMIGKIYLPDSDQVSNDFGDGTILGTMVNKGDHYIIHNPCEVEFNMVIPTSGTSELQWKLTPYCLKELIGDSSVISAAFAFPKNLTVLSNIGDTSIHSTLLSAYSEICN